MPRRLRGRLSILRWLPRGAHWTGFMHILFRRVVYRYFGALSPRQGIFDNEELTLGWFPIFLDSNRILFSELRDLTHIE